MSRTYREELDRLVFTGEEKDALLERLAASFDAPTSTDSGIRDIKKNTDDIARPPIKTIALAFLLIFTLAGGVSYALSQDLDRVPEATENLFGTDVPNRELLHKIAYPLRLSSSNNGITMTAQSVIGDRTNVAITYTIRRDDGTPFPEAARLEDGTYAYSFESPNDLWTNPIAANTGGAAWTYFYDSIPGDNMIEYVEYYSLDTSSLLGRKYEARFTNLSTYNPCLDEPTSEENPDCSPDNFQLVAEGVWSFSFTINYEDMTRQTYPFNAHLGAADGTVTITKAYISPLSMHLSGFAHHRNCGGTVGVDDPCPTVTDIQLHMRDGTTRNISPNTTQTGSIRSFLWTTWSFDQLWGEVIDPDEVVSVTVNGTEISFH